MYNVENASVFLMNKHKERNSGLNIINTQALCAKVPLSTWKCMLCAFNRIASSSNYNKYTQHTIILSKIKSDLGLWLTLIGSNPCLEQISFVPMIFETVKFDCIEMVKTKTDLSLSFK